MIHILPILFILEPGIFNLYLLTFPFWKVLVRHSWQAVWKQTRNLGRRTVSSYLWQQIGHVNTLFSGVANPSLMLAPPPWPKEITSTNECRFVLVYARKNNLCNTFRWNICLLDVQFILIIYSWYLLKNLI